MAIAAVALLSGPALVLTQGQEGFSAAKMAAVPPGLLWTDHGDASVLDLFYGVGTKERAPTPHGKFMFVSDVLGGATPKFNIRDENGVEWRAKLGIEAQTETAASRLMWGAGYFVEEHYFLPRITVEGVPRKFGSKDGVVTAVRLQRRGETKSIGDWSWQHSAFQGTQEFNALRIMMALLNNWDLKTSNNSIVQANGETHYLVGDLGATFGKTGGVGNRTKGDLADYSSQSFFDEKDHPEEVNLTLNGRPFFLFVVDFYHYRQLAAREKVGNHIPRTHAKWLGERLSQFSENQILDCFRAGGFSDLEARGYTRVVRSRINELSNL